MASLCWTLLLALLLAALSWCLFHRLKQRGRPGFRTWPLLGAALDVSANYHRIHDWILWNVEQLGCLTFTLPMPTNSYVLVADPGCVEHILRSNFSNYPKGPFFSERFQSLLGNGIFNSDGEVWRMQRKVSSFEFASNVLRNYSLEVYKEYALKLTSILSKYAEQGKVFDIQDLLLRMTLDTICKLGFGVDIGMLSPALPTNKFAAAFDKCNEISSYRFASPLWKLKRMLRLGEEGRLESYVAVVNAFTHKIIHQRRIELLEQEETERQQVKHRDLLSRFMSRDLGLSDEALRDVILNFVIAGRDTSASALSWFVYMLASYARVAQKIREELYNFCKLDDMTTFVELLTYQQVLVKLPYLHAALMETLRLHPPVPVNFKSTIQDDVLPDGTNVKAGDIICYSPWAMGRLELLWGPDVKEFRPERWMKNGEWNFNVSPFKFPAFQAGPRICLGRDSALLQMKVTCAVLCRFFKFELSQEQGEVTYRVTATMPIANGLKVLCTKLPEVDIPLCKQDTSI